MLAAFSTAGAPAPAAVSSPQPFTPAQVYALPDHRMIYDDCGDARAFADSMPGAIPQLSAQGAVDGANAFLRCFRKKRLNADADMQRYIALAAAAALYLAAQKTSGDTAMHLYKNADAICEQLGAPSPDRTIVFDKVEVGTSSSGKNMMSDQQAQTNINDRSLVGNAASTHTQIVERRDPFGGSQMLKFGDIATAMRADIAGRLEALAPSPSPSPAPSAK